MAITIPVQDNQGGDDDRQPTALEQKRRRDLAAALALVDLDEDHRRNIDDAAAKKAYVAYSDQAAALLHGDDGLLYHDGAAAHAAFPAVAAGLADAHDQAITPLSPTQRGLVASALGDRLKQDLALAGAHVREQGAVEQRAQNLALQRVAARDAVAHVGDPDLHDHYLATGENAIRQQAMIDKLPDEVRDRQVDDYQSGVHRDTIAALMPHDPTLAAGWYDRFGGSLNQRDRQRIAATLGPSPVDTRANDDVDPARAGDPATASVSPQPAADFDAGAAGRADAAAARPVARRPAAGTARGTAGAVPLSDSAERQAANRAQARQDLQDPLVRALMRLIPDMEHADNGYAQLHNTYKEKITDFSRFPSGTAAAGRYQMQEGGMFLEGQRHLGISSFTPDDQDMMLAYALRHYKIIDQVKAGDFASANHSLSRFWVSIPVRDKVNAAGKPTGVRFEDYKKRFDTLYQEELTAAAKRAPTTPTPPKPTPGAPPSLITGRYPTSAPGNYILGVKSTMP